MSARRVELTTRTLDIQSEVWPVATHRDLSEPEAVATGPMLNED